MKTIVIDTNFGIIPFQFKVDIYNEFERIINGEFALEFPRICIPEMEKLKQGRTALELMIKKGVKFVDIPLTKTVDDSIVNYAKERKAMVATQDRGLKKKTLKKGLLVITLRKKRFLIIIGGVDE